jgi:hypothetical protein
MEDFAAASPVPSRPSIQIAESERALNYVAPLNTNLTETFSDRKGESGAESAATAALETTGRRDYGTTDDRGQRTEAGGQISEADEGPLREALPQNIKWVILLP